MEPLTIAALTVLVLAGLVLEYFTGLLGRWQAAVRRRPSSEGAFTPSASIGFGDGGPLPETDRPAGSRAMLHASSRVGGFSEPIGDGRGSGWSAAMDDAARQAYMPPGMVLSIAESRPAPAPARTGMPARLPPESLVRIPAPGAARDRRAAVAAPAPAALAATAEALAADEITRIVGHLSSIENELAPAWSLEGDAKRLEPLKQLVVEYDLDSLMTFSNHALSSGVITYYRDVLVIAFTLERHRRNAARIRSLAEGERLLEQELLAIRDSVAAAGERGRQLARSLGLASAGPGRTGGTWPR